MLIRHEDSVDHWHNTSAFPIIFLDKFHSSGNMTHTIYNFFTWFNIYTPKGNGTWKILCRWNWKETSQQRDVRRSRTLESVRNSHTPPTFSPYKSLCNIANSVAEGRQKIVDASFCWEFSVGFHLGRPVQRKMRKPLSHPPDWDIKKFFCISAGWGGCSAFLNGAIKNTARQSTIDRAEAALRAQAQCPGGGAAQVRSFQEIITLDIPLDYPRYFLD